MGLLRLADRDSKADEVSQGPPSTPSVKVGEPFTAAIVPTASEQDYGVAAKSQATELRAIRAKHSVFDGRLGCRAYGSSWQY